MPFRPIPDEWKEKVGFLRMMDVFMTGEGLDGYAAEFELKRKRRFWFFKESDKRLRGRIIARIAEGPFYDEA